MTWISSLLIAFSLLVAAACVVDVTAFSLSSSSFETSLSDRERARLGSFFSEHSLKKEEKFYKSVAAAEKVTITLVDGSPLQCALLDQVVVCLGVYFGETTAGAGRWAPPRPKAATTVPRDCTKPANVCPQTKADKLWSLGVNQSEDCLSGNIFVQAKFVPSLRHRFGADDGNATTIPGGMWIYGGSWNFGSDLLVYNPFHEIVKTFSEQPMLYFVINYRVQVLGGLGGNFLFNEQKSLNWHLQDQRLALKLLNDNAAVLGIDRSRVLIFGESAGSGSISAHAVTPSTYGLWTRAILESGPTSDWQHQTMDQANGTFTDLIHKAGCASGSAAAVLSCLRAKPFEWFGDKFHAPHFKSGEVKGLIYSPVIDGVTLIANPQTLIKEHQMAPHPMMFVTNQNESTIFNNKPHNMSDALYRTLIAEVFGSGNVDELYNAYPPSLYPPVKNSGVTSAWSAASALLTDHDFCFWNREMAIAHSSLRSAMKLPTGTFVANYQAGGSIVFKILAPRLGSSHMTELFGLWDLLQFTKEEKKLSRAMVQWWHSFADSGNPNSPLNKDANGFFKPFTHSNVSKTGDSTFAIRLDGSVNIENFRRKNLDMWRKLP